MARDGWLFVGPAVAVLALGVVLGLIAAPVLGFTIAAVGLFFTIAFAFFFRDPERHAPHDPNSIIATSDGRIVVVSTHPNSGIQIHTFLSVLDVHINRAPVSGEVTECRHRSGKFELAWKDEAGSHNERQDLIIKSPIGVIRSAQIAGILARRIICRPKVGDILKQGDRIGMIRFGSRAEVIVPEGFVATVRVGDRVKGGESIIARKK